MRFVLKEPIVQRDHQNLFCVLQGHTTHSSEWETCKTALYVQSRLLTLNTVLKVATLVASSLIALRVLNNVDSSCRCKTGFDFKSTSGISMGSSSDITDCIPLVLDRCDGTN